MKLRVTPRAKVDLDEIWLHVALERSDLDAARRVVESLTDRFWLLAEHPRAGRQRDDLRVGLRSFSAGIHVIFYRINDDGLTVLRVLDGRRDLHSLLQGC